MSLYKNIPAKRKSTPAGAKEKMRKAGTKGRPTAAAFKQAAKTAKKPKKTRKACSYCNCIVTLLLRKSSVIKQLFWRLKCDKRC